MKIVLKYTAETKNYAVYTPADEAAAVGKLYVKHEVVGPKPPLTLIVEDVKEVV